MNKEVGPGQSEPSWVMPNRDPKVSDSASKKDTPIKKIGVKNLKTPAAETNPKATINAKRASSDSTDSSPRGVESGDDSNDDKSFAASEKIKSIKDKLNDVQARKGKLEDLSAKYLYGPELKSSLIATNEEHANLESELQHVQKTDTIQNANQASIDKRKESYQKDPVKSETRRLIWNNFNSSVFDKDIFNPNNVPKTSGFTILRSADSKNFKHKEELFAFLTNTIKNFSYENDVAPNRPTDREMGGTSRMDLDENDSKAQALIRSYSASNPKDENFIRENMMPPIFAKIDSMALPKNEKDNLKKEFIDHLNKELGIHLPKNLSAYESSLK